MSIAYRANRKVLIKEWLRSIARDPAQIIRPKGRYSCTCCGYARSCCGVQVAG